MKNIDEKLESWISLAYAIDAGQAKPEDYPKDFQEWYAARKGNRTNAYRDQSKRLIEQKKKK